MALSVICINQGDVRLERYKLIARERLMSFIPRARAWNEVDLQSSRLSHCRQLRPRERVWWNLLTSCRPPTRW